MEKELSPATTSLEQLAALTRISSEPDFDKKLRLIVDGLKMTGWNRVVLSLRDPSFQPTKIITAGFSEGDKEYLRNNMLPPEAWLSLFNQEELQRFRRGACYFVPGDSNWSRENLGMILADPMATGANSDAWHPRDLLCVPLYDRQQRRIGMIGLDQPEDGQRPDSRRLQTAELFAQFAASEIENAQLVSETLARSREFELLFEASNAIASTLEKDTVLRLLGEHMLQSVEADSYTVYRWEGDDALTLLTECAPAYPDNAVSARPVIGLSEGPVSQVLQEQKAAVVQIGRYDADPLPPPSWLAAGDPYTCILAPIVLSEETFGIIRLVIRGEHPKITAREMRLLTALSNQAGAALETALIFEDTYERERFYNALGNVNLAINFTLEREIVLALICSEGLRIFDVDGAYIWQLEGDFLVGSAAKGHGEKGFNDATVPLADANSFVATIARTGEATYVNHVARSNSAVHIRLPQQELVQAVLGVPLEQEGNIIGVLLLVDTENPERFTGKDITRATIFGVQVAIALRNARLFEEQRRFNEELDLRVAERTRALHEESNRVKILLRITSELAASLDQDRVLNQALHLVNEVINATEGVILLIDHETGELIFRAAFGWEMPLSPRGTPSGLMRNEGLAGWMIGHREAVIVHNTQEDLRWINRPTSSQHRSVLGVPLISNEEVIGVLMLFHMEPNAFTTQQLDLVEAAAIQVANAINNASLYQLIFDQAEQLGSMLRSERIEKANRQAILESIADGVIVADSENQITLVNMPASSILEIPSDKLIGRPVSEFLGLYSHIDDSWIQAIDEWASNADRIEQGTFLADRLRIEEKVVSVHLSPVLSENQFYGTVSIFRDITREVEVDKLKSEFVSTVSHELRTPMTSIKGYADLMLMGAAGDMSEAQSRYLQVIKNNADRLHMLVNDLLNISRIETGKTTLDLRPLDVTQIIEQIVDGHLRGRIQHESKEITVHTRIMPSLPLVNADQSRVTQILTNLLDNAFNYTPQQGKITISVKAENNFVGISIEDTGIGISKENQAKIFDRFFRAEDEAVQRVPGTGLGLAIVRSLIEMHGGQLEVLSEPRAGSTFVVKLPAVLEDGDPA